MFNLSTVLESSCRKFPERLAMSYQDHKINYVQFNSLANQLANGLVQLGIHPEDRVALSCINVPYFPIIYYAILKVGAVVVPLSVLLKRNEIAYQLNNSGAKAFFCFSDLAELPILEEGYAGFQASPKTRDFIEITPVIGTQASKAGIISFSELFKDQSSNFETHQTHADDIAVIIYTSGTTGQPKGAALTHFNLFINAQVCGDFMQTTEADTQLIVLPMFHIFAMTVMMNTGIYKGACNCLLPKFNPKEVLQLIADEKITVFAGVPTMYWALIQVPLNEKQRKKIAENLRICVSGGASLPEQVIRDFEALFDVPIIEGYGMSEGSPVVTFNHLDQKRKIGSVGTPVWGVEVKLVDSEGNTVPQGEKGELIFKGPNVMKEYYKNPQATQESLKDGWLYSGDVARQDQEGYFFIVDRIKEMIIRGGFNVYPREIEEIMMRHPAVSLVSVVGIPDDKLGEEIIACVVLKEEVQIQKEELRDWTKNQVASYKYPRRIHFMKSLPINATGKILKKELKKILLKKAP